MEPEVAKYKATEKKASQCVEKHFMLWASGSELVKTPNL